MIQEFGVMVKWFQELAARNGAEAKTAGWRLYLF
jgi:hypothetical protein